MLTNKLHEFRNAYCSLVELILRIQSRHCASGTPIRMDVWAGQEDKNGPQNNTIIIHIRTSELWGDIYPERLIGIYNDSQETNKFNNRVQT